MVIHDKATGKDITYQYYKATGVDARGRQFPAIHSRNGYYIQSINLHRGAIWGSNDNKNWKLIYRVWN